MHFLWIMVATAFTVISCAPQQITRQHFVKDLAFAGHEVTAMSESAIIQVAVMPNDLQFIDLSRWDRPESQRTPQDRLMENIDQLIERERRERPGVEASRQEVELLRLKGDVITGIAQSDALERLADVLLEMERTAQEGAYQRDLLRMQVDDPREKREAIINYYAMLISQDQDFSLDRPSPEAVDDAAFMNRMVTKLCDQIEEEAWKQASKTLLHRYVMQNMVLQPSLMGVADEYVFEHGQISGYCQPMRDEFTGQFTHDIHFQASLSPLRRFAGRIDILHDDFTMAGMGSRAYVTLLEPEGFQAPLPVLIVQRQKGLAPGFVRVVGSGFITQLFGNQGQMEILESTREIVAGDHFFVVQFQGSLIQDEREDAAYAPGVWRGMPTETVQPSRD